MTKDNVIPIGKIGQIVSHPAPYSRTPATLLLVERRTGLSRTKTLQKRVRASVMTFL